MPPNAAADDANGNAQQHANAMPPNAAADATEWTHADE